MTQTPITDLIAADPNVDPAFARQFIDPERKARDARQAYYNRCAEVGAKPDPIVADNEYFRALAHATGVQFYAGD